MSSFNANESTTKKHIDAELFLAAQKGEWDTALGEIQLGRKVSHWMWYIWPQLFGLGESQMSQKYGIPSLEAAKEYLEHEVLGVRLREITEVALNWEGEDVKALLGSETDKMKLKSCMTLFMRVSDEMESIFKKVLDKHYGGEADSATDDLLQELQTT